MNQSHRRRPAATLRSLVALAALLLLPGCCLHPAGSGSLPVVLRPQQNSNWCWAATTQMVTEFLNHGKSQCDLANQKLQRQDCCTPGCPQNGDCDQSGWPMLVECGFQTTISPAPVSWETIQSEIFCRKRPLVYTYISLSDGVGHAVVVVGYSIAAGVKYLTVNDSWPPCDGQVRILTYDEYVASTGYAHLQTSYGFLYVDGSG